MRDSEPKVWIGSNQSGTCKQGEQCDIPYGSEQFLCTSVNTKLSKPQLIKKCGGVNSTKKIKVDRAWIAQELAVISDFSTRHDVPVWIDQWGLRASAVGGDATQNQCALPTLVWLAAAPTALTGLLVWSQT